MKNLSIAQRLWLNLSLGVLITLIIVYTGFNGLFKAQSASHSLMDLQALEVVPINQLTRSYGQMIDQMMNTLLTRTEKAEHAFRIRSDEFREALVTLFESKGIALLVDENGYYRPVNEVGMPEKQAMDVQFSMLASLLQIDRILLDLKKVTASYLFLKKDIENTGVCQGSCRLVSKSTQPDFLYQG